MTLQLLQKILKHSAMSSRKSTISSSKVLDPLSTILAAHTTKTLMGTLAADPRRYVNKILESYERMFNEKPRKSRPPLEGGDHPELDTSELCDDHQTKQFQTLNWNSSNGLFHWAVLILLFMSCHSQGSEPNPGRDTLIEPKDCWISAVPT